jgi:hypothetical protein
MKIRPLVFVAAFLGSFSAVAQSPSPSASSDTLQILDKVNSFYSSSFTQLLTVTLAFLGFAGVILPIILQMVQARTFRVEQKTLHSQISSDVAAAKTELSVALEKTFKEAQAELQKTVKQELDAVNIRFTEQVAAVKGASFFLQATGYAEKGYDSYAANDFAFAARKLFEGKEEDNSQRSINRLLACLPKLDEDHFAELPSLTINLEALIKTLEDNNINNRFYDTIQDLRRNVNAAKKRSKPLPPVKKDAAAG